MTFEERLAALGVDLSDLPQSDGCHLTYDRQSRSMAEQEVYRFAGMSGQLVDIIDCLKMHQDYILHLIDIIDRMETRIVNLTGERDYLIDEYVGCECCTYGADAETFDEEPCASCVNEEHFEWSVPEDWRADDA